PRRPARVPRAPLASVDAAAGSAALPPTGDVLEGAELGGVGQGAQKLPPVAAGDDAAVEDGDDPPVVLAPQQPAEALPEADGGLGDLVGAEGVAAAAAQGVDPGPHHRVAGGGEGNLVDDHERQRVAGHV